MNGEKMEVGNPSAPKVSAWIWVGEKSQNNRIRSSYLPGNVSHGVDVEPFLGEGKMEEGSRIWPLVLILFTIPSRHTCIM